MSVLKKKVVPIQTSQTYIPAVAMHQATVSSSMRYLPIARADEPNQICGVAQRIGYTGMHDDDLAIYRLKVKEKTALRRTLADIFVMKDGMFTVYENRCRDQAGM